MLLLAPPCSWGKSRYRELEILAQLRLVVKFGHKERNIWCDLDARCFPQKQFVHQRHMTWSCVQVAPGGSFQDL